MFTACYREVHNSFSGAALRSNTSLTCEPPPTDIYEPQSSLPTKLLQVSKVSCVQYDNVFGGICRIITKSMPLHDKGDMNGNNSQLQNKFL